MTAQMTASATTRQSAVASARRGRKPRGSDRSARGVRRMTGRAAQRAHSFIVDKTSGLVLFMGRVAEPRLVTMVFIPTALGPPCPA